MLKWRTSVATLPRIRYAASTVVAVVLVLVYHSLFFLFFFFKRKSQGSSFFRFDLFNMLLTDMDVGKTVLGEESEAVNRWA